jgi:hypothetical protein
MSGGQLGSMLTSGSRSGTRLGFLRRALLSVVVCCAGAAAVSAAGWALQTVTLPRPARADRIAADASVWLHDYPYSIDIFRSGGRRVRATCLRGWYPRGHGRRRVRGSLLSLDGGLVAVETGGRRYVRFISGRQRSALPAFLAVATGCTSSLGDALYTALQRDVNLRVERAYAAHQPALALRVPQVHGERLTIYVSARQHRPLVVDSTVDGRAATARIYLAPVTRRLMSRDRRLLAGSATGPA